MELALTLRRGETLLVTLGIPLVLLLFFGSVPLVGVEGRRAEYLVPGILALAVMSTGMVALGIGTAFERHYGVLKRLGGSPLPRGGLLVAKVAAVLSVEVLQAGLVVGLAIVALAWRPTGQPALAVLVLLVGTATFCGLGLLMAGALRAEATLAVAK
jgi:ABC-2 type transport system permease protein